MFYTKKYKLYNKQLPEPQRCARHLAQLVLVRVEITIGQRKLNFQRVAQSLFGEPAVVRHLGTLRNGDAPFALVNGRLVDGRDALPHVPLGVELPVFVAVRAMPLPARVHVLVFEAHRNAIVVKCP